MWASKRENKARVEPKVWIASKTIKICAPNVLKSDANNRSIGVCINMHIQYTPVLKWEIIQPQITMHSHTANKSTERAKKTTSPCTFYFISFDTRYLTTYIAKNKCFKNSALFRFKQMDFFLLLCVLLQPAPTADNKWLE